METNVVGVYGVLKPVGSNRDVIIVKWSLEVTGNSGAQTSGVGMGGDWHKSSQ